MLLELELQELLGFLPFDSLAPADVLPVHGQVGLGVCESDCGRMWDMACSRWRQLHDEESPACGDYTYFVNSDNPRGVAPPDETS